MDFKPPLTDDRWLARVAQCGAKELEQELEMTIRSNNEWRFHALLGLNLPKDMQMDGFLDMTVRHGKVGMFRALLEKGVPFDRDEKGEVFLGTAIEEGHRALVLYLIDEQKIDFRKDDDELFVRAITNGRPEIAKDFIDRGADVNAQFGEALRMASYRGETANVKFLLEQRALPDLRNSDRTALIDAAQRGHAVILQLLLDAGADHRLFDSAALREAWEGGHTAAFRVLRKAEQASRVKDAETSRAAFAMHFPLPYSLDDLRSKKAPSGETGLLLAARGGAFDSAVLKASAGKLSPEDIRHPAGEKETVQTALSRQGKLRQFFNAELWASRREEVLAVYRALPEKRKPEVDITGVVAEIDQNHLRKKSSKIILRRTPKP